MSVFSEAAARGLAAAHGVMAECFVLTPMRPSPDVNESAVLDPSRPIATVMGIYFDPSAKPLIPNAFDPRTDQRPGTSSGTPRIEIAPEAALAAGGFRKGDILVRAVGGTRFLVNATFTTPTGLVVLHVNVL